MVEEKESDKQLDEEIQMEVATLNSYLTEEMAQQPSSKKHNYMMDQITTRVRENSEEAMTHAGYFIKLVKLQFDFLEDDELP